MKSKTPSFVLELAMKTTSLQETAIVTRLEAGRHLYNACLGEALKRLDLIVGNTKAELKQFCSELVPKQKEKRKLQ